MLCVVGMREGPRGGSSVAFGRLVRVVSSASVRCHWERTLGRDEDRAPSVGAQRLVAPASSAMQQLSALENLEQSIASPSF